MPTDSGEVVRHGHITKQGSVWLRNAMVGAALPAIRFDPTIRTRYEKLGNYIQKSCNITSDNFITPYYTKYNRLGRSSRDDTAKQSNKHTNCKRTAPSQEGALRVQANQTHPGWRKPTIRTRVRRQHADMTFVCNSQKLAK